MVKGDSPHIPSVFPWRKWPLFNTTNGTRELDGTYAMDPTNHLTVGKYMGQIYGIHGCLFLGG